MRTRKALPWFATAVLAVTAVVVFTVISADPGTKSEASAETAVLFPMTVEAPFTPAARPGPSCCDPAAEPGTGGNPLCFEGHSCCADGTWRCNNPDGTPSCAGGVVCPDGCAGRNESCSSDDDCCSGNCKRNGRCS